MGFECDLASRIHAEFSGIVRLSQEMDAWAAEDFMTVGPRWSHALDILSKTARVHNGAKAILGDRSPELVALDHHAFCVSWAHNFAGSRNTACVLDHATLELATCDQCKEGQLPCSKSLSNPAFVTRGITACRRMRDRYEHYEGYFTGTGDYQKATKKESAATKPPNRPWVEEAMSGGTDGDEIRIDVYERGGRQAYTLNVRATLAALRPVVRAIMARPAVYNERHDACTFCAERSSQ